MTQKHEARPGSLEVMQDASVTWRHMAPPGVKMDDVRRPDYWRNVIRECAQQRFPGKHAWNRIEVIAEDGTWECDLRVITAAEGLVHTRLLREWVQKLPPGRKPSVPDGYRIEHIPSNGWRALDPNGQIVAQRLTIEDEALRAAVEHARQAKAEG